MGLEAIQCLVCSNFSQRKPVGLRKTILKGVNRSTRGKENNTECETVKNQIPVIFLLRNLLNIPSSMCADFLKDIGDPCSWKIVCCKECAALVEEARRNFDDIRYLQQEFTKVQKKLKSSILASAKPKKYAKTDKSETENEAREVVRLFIINEKGDTVEAPNVYGEEDFQESPSELDARDYSVGSDDDNDISKENYISPSGHADLPSSDDEYHDDNKSDVDFKPPLEPSSSTRRRYVKMEKFSRQSSSELVVFNLNSDDNEDTVSTPTKKRKEEPLSTEAGRSEGIGCDICADIFKSQKELKRHLKTHRKCPICQKEFGRYGRLINHIKRIHDDFVKNELIDMANTGESLDNQPLLLLCDLCGKNFTEHWALKKHIRIHTSEIHACEICSKTFTRKAYLKQHLKCHEQERTIAVEEQPDLIVYL